MLQTTRGRILLDHFSKFSHPPSTIERRHHLEDLASAHSIPYQEFSFEQDWEIIRDLCEAQPAES